MELLLYGLCLALAVRYAYVLPGRWMVWRAGGTEQYPGQHAGLFWGSVAGLALALVIPIPALITRWRDRAAAWRVAAYGAWALLMAIAVFASLQQRP